MNEFEVLQSMIKDVKNDVKNLDSKVDCLELKMTRYKGFLGGITFVLSCIGAFLVMVFKVFKSGSP